MTTAAELGREDPPYATINPFSTQTEAEFDFVDPSFIESIVGQSYAAQIEWRRYQIEDRAAILARASELMLERLDVLSNLITREVGKRIRESLAEVRLAARILEYYANIGPNALRSSSLDANSGDAKVVNEPLGVIFAIEPWNYPLYQAARVAGPNLILGNSLILKHAESTPQCAIALEQIFRDAGVPDGGYVNVRLRISDVESVIRDSRVRGVTLTGGERAGARVAEIAGRHLKKTVLELGGNDPFIVLDDNDLDLVVKAAVASRMQNTGQSCNAAKRFIVMTDIYDEFVAAMRKVLATYTPGDPKDPRTRLAPMASENAARELMRQIMDAVQKGATVLAGGTRPDLRGAFVLPTILGDVTPAMRAYHEELFGPVAVVFRVMTDDEAVALANDSDYGLSAVVYGADMNRAQDVASRIESGMVWINQISGSAPELPFGGVKRSGYGRELSTLGLLEFANRRLVSAIHR